MTNQFSVIKTFIMRYLINTYKKLLSLKKALISSSSSTNENPTNQPNNAPEKDKIILAIFKVGSLFSKTK